jgi:hypothetical protein
MSPEYKAMKNMLPAFILLSLLAAVIYSFFLSSGAEFRIPVQSTPEKQVCVDGDSRPCSSGICPGMSVCNENSWGGCIISNVCEPGTKMPCYENSCTAGYKLCDECGNYGRCVYP